MKYPRNVEGFVVDHTGDKGYGFFAAHNYRAGEALCKVTGHKITDTDSRLSHRAIQISKQTRTRKAFFIEPLRFSIIWYLNHSCNSNAYFDGDVLYARRAIKKGEEITADYSLFTDYESWDMKCLCGEKTCRKLILPYCKLAIKPQKFVSSYLRV